MMSQEERIRLLIPIAGFIKEFEQVFKRSLQSDASVLSHTLEHLQHFSGKHVRPIIVGLRAQLCAGQTNERTLATALAIELLHTASLIHNDVIDWSNTRRGQPTLNAFYSNHQAVLMGDYVLSTAFLEIVSREHSQGMLRVATQAGRSLSTGELMQLSLSEAHTYREEDYYAVVDRKTGTLLEASAKLGALNVNATNEEVEHCAHLGQLMGCAFQLRNDLFDYDKLQDMGKPTGHDLIGGKVPLPLLYVLNHATPTERDEIISYLQQPIEADSIDYLLRITRERGGIDYIERQIQQILREAIDLFRSPTLSATRETLERFITLLGERQKQLTRSIEGNTLNWIDFMIMGCMAWALLKGFKRGVVSALIGVLGIIVGYVLVRWIGVPVALWISRTFGLSHGVVVVGAYAATFSLSCWGIAFLAQSTARTIKRSSLSVVNKLIGALLAGAFVIIFSSLAFNLTDFILPRGVLAQLPTIPTEEGKPTEPSQDQRDKFGLYDPVQGLIPWAALGDLTSWQDKQLKQQSSE